MTAELLKTAATEIDRLTAEVARLTTDNVAMAESIKTASEKQKKTAADMGNYGVQIAKVLLDKGLAKSAQDADVIASRCLGSHEQSLQTIAKVAGYVSAAQKLGSSVVSDTERPQTADEAWDKAFGSR